jgi:hypothetical protein
MALRDVRRGELRDCPGDHDQALSVAVNCSAAAGAWYMRITIFATPMYNERRKSTATQTMFKDLRSLRCIFRVRV